MTGWRGARARGRKMRVIFVAAVAALVAISAAARPPTHTAKRAATRAVPAPRPIVPDGPVSANFLIRFAAFRESVPPKDSFTAPQSEADLADKPFVLVLPFAEIGKGRDEAQAGWWEYDSDRQTVRIVISEAFWRGFAFDENLTPGVRLSGFNVAKSSALTGRYVGENGFGASRDVEVFHGHSVAVAAPSDEFDAEVGGGALDRVLPMSTAEARRELPGAIVKVSGRLHAFKPNRVTICGDDIHGATIDAPEDVFTRDCVFQASFERVAVEAADGRVITEWASPARGDSVWVRKASDEDIAQYYPDRAQRLGVSGKATISCTATGSGALEGCRVVSEDPADQGFGTAALKMSRLYRVPAGDGGKTVTVPIDFGIPHE
jgi:TonB family protein